MIYVALHIKISVIFDYENFEFQILDEAFLILLRVSCLQGNISHSKKSLMFNFSHLMLYG